MFNNPDRGRQLILFDGLSYDTLAPTDIDGILDYKNRIWVVYEVKYAKKNLPRGQRLALERLVQDAKEAGKHGIAIVAEHYQQDPLRSVLLASCPVREIYTTEHPHWWALGQRVTVKEVTDAYIRYYYKEGI